ncbi:MAG: aminoacetone oxidase family FAD-binding enzyme [Lachnospiraceae bacterium]|nr:aminoacetone oxidase family FAD-binding enzyme [Lachnospiraceae bacterium]
MDLVVIGAGASGMMAAITAAKAGLSVTLIERKDSCGKKLALTGNGSCNVSNRNMSEACYTTSPEDAAFVPRMLNRLPSSFPEKELTSMGIYLHEKRDGYLYPLTDSAKDTIMCFERSLKACGVDVKYNTSVTSLTKTEDGYRLETERGAYTAKRVILAMGGKSYPKTGSDGAGYTLCKKLKFSMAKTYPALTAVLCDTEFPLERLAGLRQTSKAELYRNDQRIASEVGEVQFTDYGLSGIPIFQLSTTIGRAFAEGDYKQTILSEFSVCLDLFPAFTETELCEKILENFKAFSASFDSLRGLYHTKLIDMFSGYATCKDPQKADFAKELAKASKHLLFPVRGLKEYDFCQVTGGGVRVSEINDDFEAKRYPGLYVTGELLDVTGRCGGYNLHFAFASGYLAAQDVIRKGNGND